MLGSKVSDATETYSPAYRAFAGRPNVVALVLAQDSLHSCPACVRKRAEQLKSLWPAARIMSVTLAELLHGKNGPAAADPDVDVIVDTYSMGRPVKLARVISVAWPRLIAGGRLCVENVHAFRNDSDGHLARALTGVTELAARGSAMPSILSKTFAEHDSFLVDLLRGLDHRLFGRSVVPAAEHTHLLVVRKRAVPRRRPITLLSGSVAMRPMDAPRMADEMLRRPRSNEPFNATLEDLAYTAGTDKSHDDHKYTDVYSALFDDVLRRAARNVTEIGVMYGQSMVLWNEYFESAEVWGFDNWVRHSVHNMTSAFPRVHYQYCNTLSVYGTRNGTHNKVACAAKYRLERESMDVVIDDGLHKPDANERTLANFWPLLRPGGLYVIEDVVTGGNKAGQFLGSASSWSAPGASAIAHDHRYRLQKPTALTLRDNPAFLVDPTIGHRALARFKQSLDRKWFRDEVDHNTHLLVISKADAGARLPAAARTTTSGGRSTAGASDQRLAPAPRARGR